MGQDDECIELSVPELRRLLHVLREPEDQRAKRLWWSRFRRVHQAVARRCHVARRARQLPLPRAAFPRPIRVLGLPNLTQALWERLQPLLPPQKPYTGRPAVDHRLIVEGILWKIQTGSSWREMPERFGPWSTVASRYRLWRQEGRWTRMLLVLQASEDLFLSSA
jgi:putative transposase of IS4/5 family DUF4096